MNRFKEKTRNTAGKVALFRSSFSGLTDVYGTYDPATGRSWQVKQPVTDETILSHLRGKRPYGVYLLDGDTTRAIVVDFDDIDPFPPVEFVNAAQHYRLPAFIEMSKSKGFHVWVFFTGTGVKAVKARLVVKHILDEIEHPNVEIFPKQDYLDKSVSFGNFINAPLFGGLVPEGKTVFIDPTIMKPFPDQWTFLVDVERVRENVLDDIIEINNLSIPKVNDNKMQDESTSEGFSRFGLPHCAKTMLQDGVTRFQRVSCFRLAVHFKRLGLPCDVAISALNAWAQKNEPVDGMRGITDQEIINQTSYAFNHHYTGYGCDSEAVRPFCQPSCPIYNRKQKNSE